MSWTTRPESTRDHQAVRQVNLAAFDTPVEADLVDALRDDPAWLPGLSWVAETLDGEVSGYALLTRCRIDDAPALAVGPAAVLPEYQRTGAGSAVITALLNEGRGRGERLVVVLGHPEYYPRFGFVPASGFGISAAFEYPDEALMVLPLNDSRPIPSGTLHYAPPFGV